MGCSGLGDIVLIRATLVRAIFLSIAFFGTLPPSRGLAEDGSQLPTKANEELPRQLLSLLLQRNMPKRSPILIRIFKEESELEVWKQDTIGRFELLKVYPICRWSGDLGPKINEGDRQAPEGFYTITPGLMNPNSNYYRAINTGFPNAYDRANDRHGAFLMVHGDCSSRGCYAMTDEQVGEIYSLAHEFVPRRPTVIPDPGLSVPHDAGEPGTPSHESSLGLLEDAQDRQRPFRDDASRAEG